MAFLISNRWIELRSDVQASRWRVGWNTMLVICVALEPRLRCCSSSPPSALKILITVPFMDADAISVPSGFTLMAPISVSWAWIELLNPFSATTIQMSIKSVQLTIIEHLNWALYRVGQCNRFTYGFFGSWNSAKSQRICACVHLFNKLERHECENESLLLKNDHQHVFTQLDVFDDWIKRDFRAILALVVIPNDNLVSLARQDKHNKVCSIHHLNDFYRLTQVLHLLLNLVRRAVILNDLESLCRRHCKELLALVCWNVPNQRCIFRDVFVDEIHNFFFVYHSLFGLEHMLWGRGRVRGRRIDLLICCWGWGDPESGNLKQRRVSLI